MSDPSPKASPTPDKGTGEKHNVPEKSVSDNKEKPIDKDHPHAGSDAKFPKEGKGTP